MDLVERLLIERECERLVTLYCHYVDHGEAARIVDLFSEDGVFSAPGVVTLSGRDQLQKGLGQRQERSETRTSGHICNNLLIDVQDHDNATGVVYVTVYRHDRKQGEDAGTVAPIGLPLMVGEYRDRFVRSTDGWRIAHREVATTFSRPR